MRGGKRGVKALRSRLSRPLTSGDVGLDPPSSLRKRSLVSSDASRLSRAVTLIERGLVSRATRSLFQSSLAPFTPANVDTLSRLHPPASSSALPSLPSSAPRIHVDGSIWGVS